MSDNEGTYENKDNLYDDDHNLNLDQDDDHQMGFGGFNLNMGDGDMGDTNAHLSCVGCGGNKFKITEAYLVCKKCGTENINHAINAQLEYNDIAVGKNKMKKDAIQEKVGKTAGPARGETMGSPMKRGQLILDADKATRQLDGKFILVGHQD